MFLCVDIGNTNIVLGLYREGTLVHDFRVVTDRSRMPDEYAVVLESLLHLRGSGIREVTGAIISSTVPPLTTIWAEMLERYLGRPPLVVSGKLDLGVQPLVDNPAEVGADRLVNTLAAHRLYGGPAIVIDFGTATSFDVVSAAGDFLGGAIAPGLEISSEALSRYAAKLPRIEVVPPPAVIGKNTIHCMQSGLLWGYVGLVEGLVARIQAELPAPARVIATGGLADVIAHQTPVIELVDKLLTLRGLHMIAIDHGLAS